MNDTIITWNVTNWITVVLMVAIGFTIFGLGQKVISKRLAAANANS